MSNQYHSRGTDSKAEEEVELQMVESGSTLCRSNLDNHAGNLVVLVVVGQEEEEDEDLEQDTLNLLVINHHLILDYTDQISLA